MTGLLPGGEDEGHAKDLPDFIEIEENDFDKYEASLGVSAIPPKSGRNKLGEEVFPCDCRWIPGGKKESMACGADSSCINRTLFVECRSQDCPCGEHCQNQRFQRKEYKPIRVISTPGKGHGLKCLTDLKQGDFVIEYVGEVVSQAQMQKRIEINSQLGQKHYYFMTLQSDQILDATRKGNFSRFMNHSCSPNCATQKWIVNGQVRIGLFALRNIPAGTELTFDYKFVRFSSEAQVCLCGEANCKGFIGTERKESDFFDTDEEDEDDEQVMKKPTGIDDPEIMAALAKVLLRKETTKELVPALETLLNTSSLPCLKKFVALHGLQILQIILGQHRKEDEVVCLILQILKQLPIGTKNTLDESKLDRLVGELERSDDTSPEAKDIIKELKEGWKALDHAFTIPKTKESSSLHISTSFDANRSLTPSSIESTASAGGYSLDDGHAFKKTSKWALDTAGASRSSARRDNGERDRRDRRSRSRSPESRPRGSDSRQLSAFRPRDTHPPSTRRYDHDSPKKKESRITSRDDKKPVLPAGWKEAKTGDGKVYYYNQTTRETRWDPPPVDLLAVSKPELLVEGIQGKDIQAIIARAKAAALSKSKEEPPVKPSSTDLVTPSTGKSVAKVTEVESTQDPLMSTIRNQLSEVVVKFLSRYTSQFKDQAAFKEMARKLTHGLTEKEYRGLLLGGTTNFEISRQKRRKIIDYLCQYLSAHGFKGVKPD